MLNRRVPSRFSTRIAGIEVEHVSLGNKTYSVTNRTNSRNSQEVLMQPSNNNVNNSGSQSSTDNLNNTVISTNNTTHFIPGQGPLTTSSPGSGSTIPSPAYSSLTARTIREEFRNMARNQPRLPTVDERIDPNMPINSDGLSLRDYVNASVGAAQAGILRQLEQNLAVMIPRVVRESLRSDRDMSFDNRNNSSEAMGQQNQQRQQQQPFNINVPPPGQFMDYGPPQNISFNPTGNLANMPLQLEKWGIKFDGSNKSLSVEDFVFRAEALRWDYNCPWDVFMKGFHHLMTGRANDWFWEFRQQNPTCNWDHLKYHLIKKFRNFESDFEIQRRMVERRQMPSETADAYITEIIRLKNQMRVQIPEYELVRIVKDNLKDGLSQLVFPKDINSMDELLEECKRAERNIVKRQMHRQQLQNYRRVNELEYDDFIPDESTFQVEALKPANNTQKPLTCWNCKKPGHNFVECSEEQRNLFCYKCGFEGVTSPKCQRCLGNLPRHMTKNGQSCQPQDSAQ